MLKTWSYSRLQTFESCKLRAKLQYIDKIPEPPRPLPPGKTEHANDRGTRLHDAAELFVKSNVELIPELHKFKEEFQHLKTLFKRGIVSLEGEWAHDNEWEPVAWSGASTWLRLKLDACVFPSPQRAIVIDYKSGKLYGNEIKHAEQGQLYMVSVFVRYPDVQEVTVEFWYLDQDEIVTTTYTRAQSEHFFRKYDRKGTTMTDCTEFPPSANLFSCKWCPYKPEPKGTGHCTVGVT